MIRHITWFGCLTAIAVITGCSSETSNEKADTARQPSAEGATYLATTAPDAATDIIPMRESVGDGEEVVVVGRIGGSHQPWVDGMAVFSIVDRSLAACSDIPGDGCPTPWDYCCATDKLPGATTLVKVVNDQDQVISTDARQLLGLTELQTVIVTGKASKDESGNVTILARKIYVDPTNPGQVKRGGDDPAADDAHEHGDDHDHSDDGDADSDVDEPHSHEKGES